MQTVVYARENRLDPQEFTDLLKRSTLAERRPVDDPERIRSMCEYGNLNITARVDGKLVGVSRSLSDFSFCTYLSDLAVDEAYQRRGIGVRLIAETKKHSPAAKLILLAAPKARAYYPHIGMQQWEHCYVLDSTDQLIK